MVVLTLAIEPEGHTAMPSFPTPVGTVARTADLSGVVTLLASVRDPLARRGRRHALAGLLVLGVAAVLTGARSLAAIGDWPQSMLVE